MVVGRYYIIKNLSGLFSWVSVREFLKLGNFLSERSVFVMIGHWDQDLTYANEMTTRGWFLDCFRIGVDFIGKRNHGVRELGPRAR
jgi:hypothetical protein